MSKTAAPKKTGHQLEGERRSKEAAAARAAREITKSLSASYGCDPAIDLPDQSWRDLPADETNLKNLTPRVLYKKIREARAYKTVGKLFDLHAGDRTGKAMADQLGVSVSDAATIKDAIRDLLGRLRSGVAEVIVVRRSDNAIDEAQALVTRAMALLRDESCVKEIDILEQVQRCLRDRQAAKDNVAKVTGPHDAHRADRP